MPRRFLFCLLVLIAGPLTAALGQTEEAEDWLLQACLHSSRATTTGIPYYYDQQDAPAIDSLLYAWKDSCGSINPLLYFEIVYAIGGGRFTEDMYDEQIAWRLQHYRNELLAPRRRNGSGRAEDYGVDTGWYSFISRAAQDLYDEHAAQSPVEYWLLRFLSGVDTSIIAELDNPMYDTTVLQRSFRDWRKEQPGAPGAVGFTVALNSGVWVPDGSLARLGRHPLIGLEVGGASERLEVSLYVQLRFGKAAEAYQVFADSLFSTRHHFGSGFGLNSAYTVRKGRRADVVGLGSVGYDLLTLRPSTAEENEQDNGVTRGSLLLGAGAGYRYFIGKSTYIGLEGRYNLLFFKNSGGSDFTGNAFTLTLSIGSSGGVSKQIKK